MIPFIVDGLVKSTFVVIQDLIRDLEHVEIAGFRLSNDVVVVENEWGWIEEITLPHVVVRIWDLRRLILPVTYFLEKPFQNWTRISASILGSVFLYVDYAVPVEALRQELRQILSSSPLWDQQVCALQVTDMTDKSMDEI